MKLLVFLLSICSGSLKLASMTINVIRPKAASDSLVFSCLSNQNLRRQWPSTIWFLRSVSTTFKASWFNFFYCCRALSGTWKLWPSFSNMILLNHRLSLLLTVSIWYLPPNATAYWLQKWSTFVWSCFRLLNELNSWHHPRTTLTLVTDFTKISSFAWSFHPQTLPSSI